MNNPKISNQVQRLFLPDASIELMKWIALGLMVLDHVNKHLFNERFTVIFALGRLALPLFCIVLGYNLSRPSINTKTYVRVLKRLAVYGTVASVPFIALGGLAWGWWPLNIMFMMLAAVLMMFLIERKNGWSTALAVLVFLIGGAFVEFWWAGVLCCVAAWMFFRKTSWAWFAAFVGSVAALYVINSNFWALAALPVVVAIVFFSKRTQLNIGRFKNFFYVFYPAHLALIWLIKTYI
jgi:TraX protein